jgi:aspartate/methionine/tyrosine aminotransferase
VAAVAGTAFGRYGEGFVRFSSANSPENIRIAVERLGKFCKGLET